MKRAYRRSGGLTILLVAAAIALAASSGSSNPKAASSTTVVSLGTSNSNGSGSRNAHGTSTTSPHAGNSTQLLNEWTDCMSSHGDPNQADPIVDAYGVINIHIPADAQSLSSQVHGGDGPCNSYLAAASNALRAALSFSRRTS
jgi:hypothetical protein